MFFRGGMFILSYIPCSEFSLAFFVFPDHNVAEDLTSNFSLLLFFTDSFIFIRIIDAVVVLSIRKSLDGLIGDVDSIIVGSSTWTMYINISTIPKQLNQSLQVGTNR